METHPKTIRSQIRVTILVGLAIAAALSASGQAVAPEISIWVESYSSLRPSVAFNITHEEFLVVWTNIQGPTTDDIYARRVNMDGSLGTWFSVVSSADQAHTRPDLAYNHLREEYLVAWEYEYGVGDTDVLGSLVSWSGSSVGTPFPISSAVDIQGDLDVAFNPNDDEYLVVYENNWAGGILDVDAQRVDGDGSLLSWANVASDSVIHRFSPRVAFSPELGRYIIAYMYIAQGSGRVTVACKTAPSDLAGVSTDWEYEIAPHPAHDAVNPAVAASPEGFLALFSFPFDPRARRVAADGNPQGPDTGYPVGDQTSLAYSNPMRAHGVSRADAVGVVAAWNVFNGSDWDIYTQALSPFSDRVLSSTYPVAVGGASDVLVDIACAPWGTCLVVYQSDGDIFGRIIRYGIFGDGFDETGNTSRWSLTWP